MSQMPQEMSEGQVRGELAKSRLMVEALAQENTQLTVKNAEYRAEISLLIQNTQSLQQKIVELQADIEERDNTAAERADAPDPEPEAPAEKEKPTPKRVKR